VLKTRFIESFEKRIHFVQTTVFPKI